jgi:hypothetical protein
LLINPNFFSIHVTPTCLAQSPKSASSPDCESSSSCPQNLSRLDWN